MFFLNIFRTDEWIFDKILYICIYMYEILVGNIMCCLSFISNEVMALDLSEFYLCSVPCEIIDGFLSNFLHASI